MREALLRHDFGAFFALARQWSGISFMRIADACDMKPERVGKLARGEGRVTSVEKMEQIADGLRVPGGLMRLAPRPWEGRETRPASGAALVGRDQAVPCSEAIPDLAAVRSFRAADRQLGGGHLYASVLHYLHHKMGPRIFGGEPGYDSARTLQAAAALTEMAGWMAHDTGQNQRAGDHFTKALSLAKAGEGHALSANIMASMSHLALQTGHPDKAVSMARAGHDHVTDGCRIPTLIARLHAMEARALAQLGDGNGARRSLAVARKEIDKMPDTQPIPWISSFDTPALASEAALSLQDAGRLSAAVEAAEEAIALRSGDRARSRVFSQITLALIRTRQGELEAACEVGRVLLGDCGTLGSLRITQQLDSLAEALARHRAEPIVSDFLDRLAATKRQRALILAGLGTPPAGEGTAI
ncbi:helix-turn-helix domain-containing protein [Streptomyces sp. RTd22]|uniref:helix-turn-helix domain-containing protein n=1 Tax=Streptomyces sp. RTd22 TaxID=1841249 RepID=UPI0007C49326|nr:helix-turn-helix domain-containing protein [Streptomyces sp. RTd22]